MLEKRSGSTIRQEFINFFMERDHTFVPSSSLVPGGDATLYFTTLGWFNLKMVFFAPINAPIPGQ